MLISAPSTQPLSLFDPIVEHLRQKKAVTKSEKTTTEQTSKSRPVSQTSTKSAPLWSPLRTY